MDGTLNKNGKITHECHLQIKVAGKTSITRFLVTSLGDEDIILGISWLKETNPTIDWTKGTLTLDEIKETSRKASITEIPDEEPETFWDAHETLKGEWDPSDDPLPSLQETETDDKPCEEGPAEPNLCSFTAESALKDDEHLIAYCKGEHVIGVYETRDFDTPLTNEHIPPNHQFFSTHSQLIRKAANTTQQLAQDAAKPKKSFEELIPEIFHKYQDIFSNQAMNKLPPTWKFDHGIELKPDFEPRKCKIYPLNAKEEEAMNAFIDEHLAKGSIIPSQSPQSSPFFFVGKKDGSL